MHYMQYQNSFETGIHSTILHCITYLAESLGGESAIFPSMIEPLKLPVTTEP